VLTVGCPLLGVTTYLMYTGVTSDPWLTMVLYTLAGFTVGIVAVVPYVMIALFPPEIRFSGISFSYNIAYAIFGGLTPVIVAWLLGFDRMAPAHYVGLSPCWARASEPSSLRKVQLIESPRTTE
jgi:MFS family permease